MLTVSVRRSNSTLNTHSKVFTDDEGRNREVQLGKINQRTLPGIDDF